MDAHSSKAGGQAGWAALRRWGPRLAGLYFVAALFTTLVRPAVAGVLAPAAGPWAGHLYGHAGCTMASAWPVASYAALAALPVALALALAWRRRGISGLPLFAWLLAWSALAWLSVLNSTE